MSEKISLVVDASAMPMNPEFSDRLGPFYDADAAIREVIRQQMKCIPTPAMPDTQHYGVTSTADFIVVCRINGVLHFLGSRRKERPWKNEYFLKGGRIEAGETSVTALARVVKREVGLDLDDLGHEYFGEFPTLNPESQCEPNRPWWSLWHLYVVELESVPEKFEGDGSVGDHKWFSRIPRNFPKPFADALRLAGFEFEAEEKGSLS